MNNKLIIFIVILGLLLYIIIQYTDNKTDNNIIGFEKLKYGNAEFVKNFGNGDYRGYIEKQKPHTSILCCSDSRVPVERIFNLQKGEIFVVREAGHIPNYNSIASLEYSISVLGVKNLVVLGHTECGAVKASLSNKDLGSANLNNLADDIRKNININDKLDKAILNNTRNTLKNLINNSIIISNAVLENKIKICYAIYDVKTGIVKFYD